MSTTKQFVTSAPLGAMTLETLVGEAVGAASMSWGEAPKGTFDSEFAISICKTIVSYVNDRYVPRPYTMVPQTNPGSE